MSVKTSELKLLSEKKKTHQAHFITCGLNLKSGTLLKSRYYV